MVDTSSRLYSILKILVVIFLILYWLSDSWFDAFWIVSIIPLIMVGILLLVILIIALFKKNHAILLLWLFLILCISITEILRSELFKSKIVLTATLKDDRSAILLKLRENKKFELVSDFMFGRDVFIGNYHLVGNKIIFMNKAFKNDFIPDTLTIIDDNLVMQFDSSGNPLLGYGSYFTIEENKIIHSELKFKNN